jgi:isoquinoline 1-oxidoreductase
MPDPTRVAVNGVDHEVSTESAELLLDWLREDLRLTGTKYGCGEAACGACSVLIDGTLARACVTSTRDVDGCSVTTIEGLARGDELHPVQRAFVDAGAMQCGFCTPGMIVATVAMLHAHPHPSDDEIARWMAPNLCRCCTYPRILAAIRRATEPPQAEPGEAPATTGEPDPPVRPRVPWDLQLVDDRDYFTVLGDGLVVVAPPPAAAPGMWAPTGGAWLHVAPGGAVTAFTGKVDVGQGTRRALRLLVAEELGVRLTRVRLVMGDTDLCPFDVGTFGSMSMRTAAVDLRQAAAGAREALGDGTEMEPGVRRVAVAAPDQLLRAASEWRVAGHEWRGGDPASATGAKQFASDLSRPGMRHAKLLHPPQYGAQLRTLDVSAAQALPGVTIVSDGELIAALAETPAAAARAIEAVSAQWEPAETVAEADLESYLREHPRATEGWGGAYAHDVGDVNAELSVAAVRLAQTYTAPYLAHAPLETRVAVAEWDDARLTVWTGTQQPFGVRRSLAEALGLDQQQVRVVVPSTGAGFGGKHEPDLAIATARLAHAAGTAVKLHWTREEEFTWGYFRPAAVIDVTAGMTSDGQITAWEFVNVNAGSAGIGIPYDVGSERLRFQPAASPLRQGAYRALAATTNNFARESFIDELARVLHADPVQFRLDHLSDDRLVAVLQLAAQRFGWADHPREEGYGIGIAAGAEKGGRVATCVLVRGDDELPTVLRVVTAFECGAIVDPDGLTNQIEGATIMGLGGALFEAVHFGAGRVLNGRLSEYRVPRFPDVPPIEVVLVDRPDLDSAGAGETPIIAIAPAVANAIFDATGRRIRSLPLLQD